MALYSLIVAACWSAVKKLLTHSLTNKLSSLTMNRRFAPVATQKEIQLYHNMFQLTSWDTPYMLSYIHVLNFSLLVFLERLAYGPNRGVHLFILTYTERCWSVCFTIQSPMTLARVAFKRLSIKQTLLIMVSKSKIFFCHSNDSTSSHALNQLGVQ